MTDGRPYGEARRISPSAYRALSEALGAVFWYKQPFERYLRRAFRDHPELLAGLDFQRPKRAVADQVVDDLAADPRYRELTLWLMLAIAEMESFPDIERIKDRPDRLLRLEEARRAVTALRRFTVELDTELRGREDFERERVAFLKQTQIAQDLERQLATLKAWFVENRSTEDPHRRGREFERFLRDLFALFDLEPRLAYNLAHEQIDGSLSYDTDNYIIEAKWLATSIEREDMDILARKVERKGKNTLGLFISVNGFSRGGLATFNEGTPFITMDGSDLFFILDRRIQLDELLRAKKRHASETGSCYFPATRLFEEA